MSEHGRAILSRMLGMIDAYGTGRVSLRGLVDDLGSMYQSLEPTEQPPEREWMDDFVPLDRVDVETEGEDGLRMKRRVEEHLSSLRSLLARAGRPV